MEVSYSLTWRAAESRVITVTIPIWSEIANSFSSLLPGSLCGAGIGDRKNCAENCEVSTCKGIRERLLKQAAIKFHQWQEATYPGKTSERDRR